MTCFDCKNAIFCECWGEIRCKAKTRRIYKILGEDTCEHFNKRGKGNILDTPCQCEDCLSRRGEEE